MEVLTHTKRRDFQNCRRYYYHRHVQHLSPRLQKGGRRRGAAFGEAIFAVLQDKRVREHTSLEDAPPIEDVIEESLAKSYSEVYPSNQEEQDELDLEIVKLSIIIPEYVRRYGVHERRELEFEAPLPNPTTGYTSRAFRLGGKIDGMLPRGNKHVTLVEDKLVKQIQQAMIDRLPLDHQVTEYVDAILRRGFTADVWYRHTRFPTSEPKLIGTKKTGGRRRETLTEYAMRLSEDVLDRPEHYFDQQHIIFPKEHLDDYRKGRWGVAQQILQARRDARSKGHEVAYPMNPSRCWEYGGCEFIPLCTKREGADNLYIVVPDNPELSRKDDDGTTSEYPAAAA